MTMEVNAKYSLREIRNFIERSLDDFVREHEAELVRIVKEDTSDVPNIPGYEQFYFSELVPQIRERMQQSGYDKRQIKEMIAHGDALFYRSILPNVCRTYRERNYVGIR